MSWMKDMLARLHRCSTVEEMSRQMLDVNRRLQKKDRVDGTQDERIRDLEHKNGELRLYLAALIWLLLKNEGITPADLAELVDAVDRSDGCCDGRYDGDIAAWGVSGEE